MAKKKSTRNKVKPKKQKHNTASRFNCPECSNENVVHCKVEKKKSGYAHCTICEASFGCPATELTQPIDIYSAWIDYING